MNSQQVAFLNKLVERYLNAKYPKIHNTTSISDKKYLELFDANTIDTSDIFQANFILPDGRLKKFQLNLAEFKIPDIYTINFKVSNENIYDILNLKHEQVKYLGFDIDKLLDLGCIRIGNNKLSKEVYLHMNLRKKLCNKIINIFEECLIHYDYILIEFLNLEEEIFSKYSLKDGNTIKDIIKDMNIILSRNQK